MFKISEQLVMGLDIGSSKITCTVGEVSPTGRIKIWGFNEAPSLGWRKGTVIDAELAAASLREIVKPVKFAGGGEPVYVRVGISPMSIDTFSQKAEIPITGDGHRVTKEDLWHAFQVIKTQTVPENRKILHTIPTGYYIDNHLIKEPLGKTGNNLTVEALVITTESEPVNKLVEVTQRAGIKVKEVMLSCLASAEVALNATDKEFGAVHVDMGGQTTGIAVYAHGYLKDVVVLPIGSDHITSDLAIGLSTPLACAEQIKLQYGVEPNFSTGGEIEVDSLAGTEKRQISCRLAVDIIEARVNEILALVGEIVKRINHSGFIPSGIIMGGSGAMLAGLLKLAEKQLGLPVRTRMPEVHLKPGVEIDNTACWGAVGLIKNQVCPNKGERPSRCNQNIHSEAASTGLMDKFKTWIHGHF